MLPVKKVIVLTPDAQGDGKSQDDFGILVKSFKPADTEKWNQSLLNEINSYIEELVNISYELHNLN